MTAKLPFSRVLVTGADGFVGRHLMPALQQAMPSDARTVIASRSPSTIPGVEQVALDLTDAAQVAEVVGSVRPDLLVHLAAQSSVGQSLGAAAATWAVNLGGSLALAGAMAKLEQPSTTLFVSSAEVYGKAYNDGIATERTIPCPQSAYARSKAAAEQMLDDVLPASSRLIVVRPSNHSGAGQDDRFVVPAIASQIAMVEQGRAEQVKVGNLDAERDFLDVRDVVQAYIALLAKAETLPSRTIFNIGSGSPIKIQAILDSLCAMADRPIRIERDASRMRPSEIARAALDCSAIFDAIGWQPKHSVDDMLRTVLSDRRSAV